MTQAIPPKAVQKSDTNPQGLPVEGYSYDAVHNRQTSQHQPGEWSYNQNHQLLGFGTEDNKTTYSYNPLGHTAQETKIQTIPTSTLRTRDYVYNAAERLTEVKENNQTIAKYQYDPFGRRISKTVNGNTTWYQYDDEGLVAKYDGASLVTHKSVNYGTNADDRCPTGHEERRTNSIACGAGGNAPDGP